MKKKIHISVALTTFNGEQFLREQLDSIYHQTLLPDEVIVSDDGSSDSTPLILEEYHKRYGLCYFIQSRNIGYNANFYYAISMCKGDYIALCDQDDVWLETKIADTYEAMQKVENGPTVISTQSLSTDASLKPLAKSQQHHCKSTPNKFTYIAMTGNEQGCTLLINRKMKDTILPLVHSHEDLRECYTYDAVICIIAASIGTMYTLDKETMLYRHHQNNAIGKLTKSGYTFTDKIYLRSRYIHFTDDDRLNALEIIYTYYMPQMDNNVRQYYSILRTINHTHNIYYGIYKIFTLPLPLNKKINISFYSIANHLLKLVIRQ